MKIVNEVWVFDLDDTLYSEIDYQRSGYSYLASIIAELFGEDITDVIDEAVESNSDVLSAICIYLKCPDITKESLLWLYRLHKPKIKLSQNVESTLQKFKASALAVAIITDGRSISQRMKVSSLGLNDYELLISEEWQENKPEPRRFEYLMNKYIHADRFVYVGDNIKKDFITPNRLGWKTIGILDKGYNIHSQNTNEVKDELLPQSWISNFSELMDYLC